MPVHRYPRKAVWKGEDHPGYSYSMAIDGPRGELAFFLKDGSRRTDLKNKYSEGDFEEIISHKDGDWIEVFDHHIGSSPEQQKRDRETLLRSIARDLRDRLNNLDAMQG